MTSSQWPKLKALRLCNFNQEMELILKFNSPLDLDSGEICDIKAMKSREGAMKLPVEFPEPG